MSLERSPLQIKRSKLTNNKYHRASYFAPQRDSSTFSWQRRNGGTQYGEKKGSLNAMMTPAFLLKCLSFPETVENLSR